MGIKVKYNTDVIAEWGLQCLDQTLLCSFGKVDNVGVHNNVKIHFPMGVPTTRVISDFTTLICALVLEAKGF